MTFRPVTSDADWEAARAIRHRVFIEEQGCAPEEEWDGHDATSQHVLGMAGGELAATARWRTVTHGGEAVAKLERFAVVPEYRGRGYGRALVQHMLGEARQAGLHTFYLHAQAHLESFYASFGFVREGEPFEEAGIPHVAMLRRDDE